MSKTHYRKAFKTPYLAAVDLAGPVTLTIAKVVLEGDLTKRSKEQFNTAYFVEREIRPGEAIKPMILNATNCKFLSDHTESPMIDDWAETRVSVYVERGVRFGKDTVDGLRIGPPPNYLSAAQVQGIQEKAEAVGVDTKDICAAYNVTDLGELESTLYARILKRLASKEAAE